MNYKIHTETCNRCKGTGKFRETEDYPCFECKGKKIIEKIIYPVTDYFREVDFYETDAFVCEQCGKWWQTTIESCELDNDSFDGQLYECTCDALHDVCGEWDYIYHVDGRIVRTDCNGE